MSLNLRQCVRITLVSLLAASFIVPAQLIADSHVVSPSDLQKELVAASQERRHNVETIRQFLSTPMAEKAMKSAQIDSRQVKTAVATLDDQELAQLASRANKAQADFAAGSLSERDLLLIIIAIAVIVLIIVAVR